MALTVLAAHADPSYRGRAMHKPLLLGHCGARRYAPENSPEAFRLALAHGCDGFEFDVRLSCDGQPVVCHDPKYAGMEIARASAEEIRRRLQLPTLSQILDEFASLAFLNVEIKVIGGERAVLALLEEHRPQNGCVVSSFLPEVLQGLREYHSPWPLGLICETEAQLTGGRSTPIQAVMLHLNLVTPYLVRQLQRADKQVFAWTVNDRNRMREIAGYGADGIISDDTLLLAKTLASGTHSRTPH